MWDDMLRQIDASKMKGKLISKNSQVLTTHPHTPPL